MAGRFLQVTVAVLFFCTGAPQEARAQVPAEGQDPSFILVAGGRGSCPWASHPGESPLWDELRRRLPLEREVIVARSCFHFSNGRVMSWDLKRIDSHGRAQSVLSWEWGDVDELKRALRPWLKRSGRLTFVGQSYGGFVAHRLAHKIAPRLQEETVLFTVDPISPRQCGVSSFLTDSPNCQGFPTDMERLSSDTVFRGTWLNFFQDDFRLLHSGPSEFASRNVKLDYEGFSWRFMGAHKLTESDPRVWERIMEAL